MVLVGQLLTLARPRSRWLMSLLRMKMTTESLPALPPPIGILGMTATKLISSLILMTLTVRSPAPAR
jgi:hypothetical protein